MWPKVWQVACTVDHVEEPGDYFEYRCGPYSVLIVRGDDGTLRAFQNVCRHRGNSLCAGSGAGLRELRCGYHGWTWDLGGVLKRVPNRKGFGTLQLSELPLIPVRVDTWERLVFVNLDLEADSGVCGRGWAAGVEGARLDHGVDEYRCRWIGSSGGPP